MMRFLRALLQAVRLTLAGESLTPRHFRPLEAWIERALALLNEAERAAAAQSLDLAALQLKLDGRPTSLERTLQMLRHNLLNEYPRLIRLDDAFSMMVVNASNLNDQYRVSEFLAQSEIPKETRAALESLNTHLRDLPQPDRDESDAL